MFGDTFGTKSDYTKGMQYSVRMSYMGDEAGDLSMQPPDTMFLSREQARKMVATPDMEAVGEISALDFGSPPRKGGGERRGSSSPTAEGGGEFFKGNSALNFLKAPASSPKARSAAMKENAQKNALRKAREEALLKEPDPADVWYVEEQAGTTFFVHRLTGEATLENPFDKTPKKFEDLEIVKPRIDPGLSTPLATGAACYEEVKGSFEEVMSFLDEQAAKPKKEKKKAPSSSSKKK